MSVEAGTQEDSTAGVIPAAPWRIKAISVLPGYRLSVTFRDGSTGVVDLSAVRPVPSQGLFSALADPAVFKQARVELGVVTWPNGADLDPFWMYEEISAAGDKTWSPFSPFSPRCVVAVASNGGVPLTSTLSLGKRGARRSIIVQDEIGGEP